MGYMRHHAIICTSWKLEALREVRDRAIAIGARVTEITEEVTNGYYSFLIAPDGSKEGWNDSDVGDGRREIIKAALRRHYSGDGGTYVDWVEVQFGDENRQAKIVGSSDDDLSAQPDADERGGETA